ncbi:MAG: hypothetical protein Q9169_004120 [Polycauliona sp. 2 TL-2023]
MTEKPAPGPHQFYRDQIGPRLKPQARALFENYCGIAPEGVPTTNLFASDIIPDFWLLGFDLFRDRATFDARFIQSDILDRESALMKGEHKGKMDIILVNQLFHLFSRETQVQMAKNVVELGTRDAWVAGWQIGGRNGVPSGRHKGTVAGSDERLFHNDRSWKEMWGQVGRETGTRWVVETLELPLEAWGFEREDTVWLDESSVGFEFICRRVG